MGVDFIREQSGKTWRKRWNNGLDRLKMPSLFDIQFAEHRRLVSADLDADVTVKAGDSVVVQCNGQDVVICTGQQRVRSLPGIPADLRTAIFNSGGVALGIIERVGIFGNNAELSIR
jgi:hypothetical protein